MRVFHLVATLGLGSIPAAGAIAQPAPTVAYKSLSTESALKAAEAALKKCRDSGWQAAVAVVDRGGTTLALLRDRYAGAHTPDTAIGKAWTAASFRIPTRELAEQTKPGSATSGIRNLPRVVAIGGGFPIEAAGQLLGAIGVSGAPGPENDETCAKAGIADIADSLEF
jgi:uncharacterized protein GlcG (DUF336 family)